MSDPDRPGDAGDVARLQAELTAARERIQHLEDRLRLQEFKLEQTQSALWLLATLVHQLDAPTMLLDLEGRILEASPTIEKRIGQSRRDLVGHRLLDVVSAESFKQAEQMLAKGRQGQRTHNALGLWLPTSLETSRTVMFSLRDPRGAIVGLAIAEDLREVEATETMLLDLNSELRELALIDSLTKLSNRRHFEQTLGSEVARANRRLSRLSLLMIDIDEFKNFNDTFGHTAGDTCLHAIGHAMKSCLRRPADFLARLGGEEFVAILPNTDVAGARVIADNMRRAVAGLHKSPVLNIPRQVTVSVGVACARMGDGVPSTLLTETADRALYEAKAAGRDRVVVSDLGVGSNSLAKPARATTAEREANSDA